MINLFYMHISPAKWADVSVNIAWKIEYLPVIRLNIVQEMARNERCVVKGILHLISGKGSISADNALHVMHCFSQR